MQDPQSKPEGPGQAGLRRVAPSPGLIGQIEVSLILWGVRGSDLFMDIPMAVHTFNECH